MIRMLFDYLFIECSPIRIPFDCLPEVSQFFLDKDPYFWISFMVVSIIVLSRLNKEMKESSIRAFSSSSAVTLFSKGIEGSPVKEAYSSPIRSSSR